MGLGLVRRWDAAREGMKTGALRHMDWGSWHKPGENWACRFLYALSREIGLAILEHPAPVAQLARAHP